MRNYTTCRTLLASMIILLMIFSTPLIPEVEMIVDDTELQIENEQDGSLAPESRSTPSSTVSYTEDFTTTTYKDTANTNASWFESGRLDMLSADLSLVGSYDSPGFQRDVWVEGDYAFIAEDGFGLRVVNITDPSDPQSVASLTSSAATWGIFVDGDYAYLCDYYTGLRVIDISDPTTPSEIGSFVSSGRIIGVSIHGDYAFVSDYDFGLRVLDISDPSNPLEVGNVSAPGCYHIDIAGNYLYLANDDSGLRIINITIPSSPQIVATYSTGGRVRGVSIEGNCAYLADADLGLQVADITDPVSPTSLGGSDTSGSSWDICVEGDYAYVAGFYYGMWIFDISSPSNPILVNQYDNTDRSIGLDVEGEYAYLCDGDDGLKIIQIAEVTTPIKVGDYNPATGNLRDVSVDGNYAYVVDDVNGFQVLNITNPEQPYLINSHPLGTVPLKVEIAGNYAFIADYLSSTGLQVINITDPTDLSVVGYYNASFLSFCVAGDFVYGASFDSKQMLVLNISDITQITLAGSYTSSLEIRDVCVSGNYAYVGSSDGTIVLDISNPTTPTYAGWYGEGMGFANLSVEAAGNYLYVACGSSGFLVLDIHNPTTPTYAGSYNTPESAWDVEIVGNYAFICDGDWPSGLLVFNISDPTNPTLVWSLGLSSYTNRLDIFGNYAYIAGLTAGLQVVRISDSLCRFDESFSVAQSTVIFSSSTELIFQASISLEGNYEWQFPDEDVMTYLSVDGGRNWEYVVPVNVTISFTTPGSELCWKIELYTTHEYEGPLITSMTIRYSTMVGFDYYEDFDGTTFMDASQTNVTGWGDGQISITGSIGTYDSLVTAQSSQVESLGYGILSYAEVLYNSSMPAGTDIAFYLSADNGLHWESITGTLYFTYPGNQLKWKAYLTTSDNNVTPSISDIYISVQIRSPQITPGDGTFTSDSTPLFMWGSLPGVSVYKFTAWNSNGTDSVESLIDGSTQYTPVSPMIDGAWDWFIAPFQSGYYFPTSDFRLLVIDTIHPTWNQSLMDQLVETGEEFSYKVNASDINGIHHYWLNDTSYFQIDGNGVIANSTHVPAGVYSLEVRAYDPAFLYCTSEITVTVLDTVLPVWEQTPANQVSELGDIFEYQVSAVDLGAIHHYWLDDTTNFEIDVRGVISNSSFLPVGTYPLEIRAYDPSNNYCTEDITVTVEDTTAPAWIDLPENQVIEFGEELSYQLYASDPSGISQWTVDDTTHFAVVDGLVSNLVTLESGIYSVQVSAEDAYGNVVSETFTVYVLPEGGQIVPPPDLSPLYLIIGVAGGAAVMVVVMLLLNRRGSK